MAAPRPRWSSAKGLIRSEVGKQLGMRHTPIARVHPRRAARERPRTSRTCWPRPAQSDEEVAAPRAGAAYAGEADPYKQARDEDADDDATTVDESTTTRDRRR